MALMTTTAPAVIFRARNNQFEIYFRCHGLGQELPEAGPTGSAIELGF
jgi:hypothetical protein